MNPSAFDDFARQYDAEFTHTRLGQLLRRRVWRVLAQEFSIGQHLLELACGTGEDAVWLAQRGVQVTATDGSAEMVRATAVKVQQAGVDESVTAVQLSLQALIGGSQPDIEALDVVSGQGEAAYDGALSNFGGLNSIDQWHPLAERLAQLITPNGRLVLVVMGPFCPWEIGWHLLHREWQTAVRRFRKTTSATIGSSTIPIWYPSARQLHQAFSPWFRHVRTESLGLWLPPTYLSHFVERWPAFFEGLNQLESHTAHVTGGWGDHYVLVLERQTGVLKNLTFRDVDK